MEVSFGVWENLSMRYHFVTKSGRRYQGFW